MLILVWVVYLCLSVNLRQMFCVTAVFLIVLFCIIWLALWLYNKSTWEEVCSLLLFVCLCFHRNTQKSQARLSWFACCFARTKHPFPSYRIKPYLYCCCHGDIQLSAEAALQHPDWLIASRQVRLSSQLRWNAWQAVLIGWQQIQGHLQLSLMWQVLIGRSNHGSWQSGWLAGCHFYL